MVLWLFYVRDRHITGENKIDACIETGTRNFKANGMNSSAIESELKKTKIVRGILCGKFVLMYSQHTVVISMINILLMKIKERKKN